MQRLKALPKDAHLVLNIIILHVPLPAIALLSIPHLDWELSLMYLCLVPWLIFAVSYFFFSFLGTKFGWEKSMIGCLIITAGLGNTSFVGFPVIEALFGKESLRYAILLDQPGSFLIVSSVGIWVAAQFSSAKLSSVELMKKVLLFPPFIGFFGALILGLLGWRAEGTTQVILERLSLILTPMALISVGLQLRMKEIKDDIKFLSYGLGFKLFLAPLMIFVLYSLLGIEKKLFQISVMEAAMAPMITASILAASQGLQPKLAGSMVGVGVPLSFLTLGIWYYFI